MRRFTCSSIRRIRSGGRSARQTDTALTGQSDPKRHQGRAAPFENNREHPAFGRVQDSDTASVLRMRRSGPHRRMREVLRLRIRNQRVSKAISATAFALLLISSGASATECQSSPSHDGKRWSWRMVDSKRCWYQGRPGRSKGLLQGGMPSPLPVVTRPDPGPPPAPPAPPQQTTNAVDTTPKMVSTVSVPAPTSKAQEAASPPSLPEPPPSAKPTKSSNWWLLLLIVASIAAGLAVVALEFLRQPNWQARLLGHLDLMGDNITRWSRRASRPVQIDPTSPSSEKPSRRLWYRRRNTPIATASSSNTPSSSLTTFDPKSLVVN